MLLSVIVVTYNHHSLVKNLLDSIQEFNDLGNDLELIIVDNSPQNSIVSFFEKKEFDLNIRWIKNENTGYGAGNNVGARIALSDNLLFLNPDIVLVEPIFQYAVNKLASFDLFGVQLIQTNHKKNFSFRCNSPYSLSATIGNRVGKVLNKFDYRKHYIVGADIFIKKDVFLKAGMFDENIFMYNEEFDLISRVRLAGEYNIGFFPEKKMIHLEGSGEYEKFDLDQRKRFLQSYQYICKKFNLNYLKKLKQQYRFLKIRKSFVVLKRKSTESINLLMELYKEKIQTEKGKM